VLLQLDVHQSKGAAVLLTSAATLGCTRSDRWAAKQLEAAGGSLAAAVSAETSELLHKSTTAQASRLRLLVCFSY